MAKRGWKVLVGSAWGMACHKWKDLPPGVVLLKSLNALDAKLAAEANAAGHLVAVLSEELFGLAPEEWLYRAEIDPIALSMADLLCAQGEVSAAILRRMTDPAKVVVTGHPRAAQPRTAAPRGDRIVLCTMAGTVNGQKPFADYCRLMIKVLGKPCEGDLRRLLEEQIDHEIDNIPRVIEAAAKLRAAFGDKVLVRPHPVEDKTTFDWGDDATPFTERLKTAACVVFVSGCGTGLEATLAGVPCVRLGSGGHGVSSRLGIALTFADQSDLVQTVDGAMRDSVMPVPDGTFAHPVTLASALEALQRTNAANVKGDIVKSIAARPVQWEPGAFEINKFPPLETATVSAYASHPLRRVGWNLFSGEPP